jgi:hypothetical protein
LGDQIKKNYVSGTCSTYGEIKEACKFSVRKPEGKRPPERLRREWEYNIKMHLLK